MSERETVISPYSHQIEWIEYEPDLDMFVTKCFRTTPEMLEKHLGTIRARGERKRGKVLGLNVTSIG